MSDACSGTPLPPEQALANLAKVDHLVVLMMEDRSFDQMLGFLGVEKGRNEVDGVRPEFGNDHAGRHYRIHAATSTKLVKAQDPCHSAWCVDEQVANGAGGYVDNFAKTRQLPLPEAQLGIVIAYHTAEQPPVYDYLAEQFCVCNRWFCSVPGATVPNRLYAACGCAAASGDPAHPPLYNVPLLSRKLGNAGISWCWYSHDDFPTLWSLASGYALSHPRVPAYS